MKKFTYAIIAAFAAVILIGLSQGRPGSATAPALAGCICGPGCDCSPCLCDGAGAVAKLTTVTETGGCPCPDGCGCGDRCRCCSSDKIIQTKIINAVTDDLAK